MCFNVHKYDTVDRNVSYNNKFKYMRNIRLKYIINIQLTDIYYSG